MPMIGFDRETLISDLVVDEGLRPFIYDDAAPAAKIGPGYRFVGNPTIGIGHALALTPFTTDQCRTICGWDVDAKAKELYAALSWLSGLSEPRQRAVANMAFNMGVAGVRGFTTFLALLEKADYGGAAYDLRTTLWARQVGARATRIEALIRGG